MFITNIMYIAKTAIWPWLFDHNDDIGVFLRFNGKDLIRWYAICILLGMVLCLLRCRKELKYKGLPEDYYDNFFFSVIPIALVGTRLWYVIANFSEFNKGNFIDSFLAIIGFSNGRFELSGLAVQGGVLFGVLWGIIYFSKIKKKYPLGLHFDICVSSIFIGQILGRWGNFFNGEVYGKLVDRSKLSWWIPSFVIDYCTGIGSNSQIGKSSVHIPLFYIESMINIIGFILIGVLAWRFWKKFRKPYQVGFLYFIWYGTVRLCLEPLRDDQFIMPGFLKLPASMFMSIIYIIIGVVGFIVAFIYYRNVKDIDDAYMVNYFKKQEAEKQTLHDEELNKKIEAKKAEIRARKNGEMNGKAI